MNRRRALRVALAAVAVAISLPVLVLWHRSHDADALVAAARARLEAPFPAAPTLERLDARGAATDLEHAISLGRDDDETRGLAHLAHALEDLRAGDLILAEGELSSARESLHADGVLLDLTSAAIAQHGGRLANAATRAASAHEEDPEDARATLLVATIALDREDPATTRELLDTLCADEPGVAEPLRIRGLALGRLGDVAAAERDLVRATSLDVHDPAAPVGLGELRRKDGRPREAVAAFDEALRRSGASGEAVLGRGLAFAALHDHVAAERDLRRAAELDPRDATPWLALGDLARDAGDVAGSERFYRQGLDVDDAEPAGWVKLGNALVRAGRAADAVPAFRRAVTLAPRLAAAHQGLGVALLAVGDASGAREALEEAALLSPDDGLARAALARLDR